MGKFLLRTHSRHSAKTFNCKKTKGQWIVSPLAYLFTRPLVEVGVFVAAGGADDTLRDTLVVILDVVGELFGAGEDRLRDALDCLGAAQRGGQGQLQGVEEDGQVCQGDGDRLRTLAAVEAEGAILPRLSLGSIAEGEGAGEHVSRAQLLLIGGAVLHHVAHDSEEVRQLFDRNLLLTGALALATAEDDPEVPITVHAGGDGFGQDDSGGLGGGSDGVGGDGELGLGRHSEYPARW